MKFVVSPGDGFRHDFDDPGLKWIEVRATTMSGWSRRVDAGRAGGDA